MTEIRRVAGTQERVPATVLRLDRVQVDAPRVPGARPAVLLHDLSWRMRAGEHWAVLGANGAGKTTLLETVAGVRPVAAGDVSVLGLPLGSPRMRDPRRHLGVIDAAPRPFAGRMGPLDVVLNGVAGSVAEQGRRPAPEERRRALHLLEQLGCGALLERRYQDCSRGERQRVLIARALIRRPRLLLFDEPAAGLDVLGRETLLQAVATLAAEQPGIATVTVTHHIEELPATTTHALLLRAGRVTEQGPVERAMSAESLSACFGIALTVWRDRGRWFAQGR